MRGACACLVLVSVLAGRAWCADPDTVAFRPAVLGRDPGSLIDRLRVPDDAGARDLQIVVLCQVRVFDGGGFGSAWCASANEPGPKQPFRAEVLRALRGARFIPAEIQGMRTGVVMPCMVIFRCAGTACSIDAYPNLGNQQVEFGLNYSAPQVIADQHAAHLSLTRVDRFWHGFVIPNGPLRSDCTAPGGRCFPMVFAMGAEPWDSAGYIVSVAVDDAGVASDARPGAVDTPDPGPGPDLRQLESLSFIPGFVEGRATPMRWFGMLLFRIRKR